VKRLVFLSLCSAALAALVLPTTSTHAQSITEDSSANTIEIFAQPFNVTSSMNAQFVMHVSAGALANRNNRLEFQLHRRLASREALKSIANGDTASSVIDTVSYRLSRVSRTSAGDLVATVPLLQATNNQVSLLVNQDGIFPLTIRIVDNTSTKTIASVLTFINKRSAPEKLTTVQATTFLALTHPPTLSPNGLFELSDEVRAKTQRFVDYLAKNQRAATLYIQPEIVAALATSTDSIDVALIGALREQLRTRSITTATFAPTDVSMMANAGLNDEFVEQLRLGESTLTKYLPGINIVRNTWVSNSEIDSRGLALLHKAGITGLILLNDGQTGAKFEGPRAVIARPDGSSQQFMSVICVDADVSSQLAAASIPMDVMYRTAAELLIERDDLIAAGTPADTVRLVIASDINSTTSLDAFDVVARAVATAPGVKMTDMTIAQTVTESTPAIHFMALTPNNGAAIRNSLAYSRAQLNAVLSMFAPGDIQSDTLNYLLGIAASTIAPQPAAYTTGLDTLLAQLRGAVTVTTPREVTLSGRKSTIRLQVRNDSKSDLTVVVRLSSVKLYLEKPLRVITLPAGSTTEVTIPATTRTNGRFPIGIRVSTPEGGVDVVPYQTITAKVTAIAGLGQLISITLLLMLLAWWWSHSRRSRLEGSDEEPVGTTVSHQ